MNKKRLITTIVSTAFVLTVLAGALGFTLYKNGSTGAKAASTRIQQSCASSVSLIDRGGGIVNIAGGAIDTSYPQTYLQPVQYLVTIAVQGRQPQTYQIQDGNNPAVYSTFKSPMLPFDINSGYYPVTGTVVAIARGVKCAPATTSITPIRP